MLAFVALGVVVAWLAWGRSGEDAGRETAADGTTTTTESPTTTTTRPRRTTTEAPASTTTPPLPSPGVLDVSTVPAQLADLTLILFHGDDAAALELASGQLTPFEAPEAPHRSNVWLEVTPMGILEVSHNTGDGRLIDWDMQESDRFSGAFWPGEMVIGDDEIWFMRYEEVPEIVHRAADEPTSVIRLHAGWVQLVGRSGDAVLVNSPGSGRVHGVEPDGTITVAYDGIALGGGTDWLLVPECDDQLRCSTLAVDLRTGARLVVTEGVIEHSPVVLSADGRRAFVSDWWNESWPPGRIIDIDAGTITESSVEFDPIGTTTDPTLRYVIHPDDTLIRFQEMATGEEAGVELPQEIDHVVVAPDGWVPPGR